jgi:hypothetical protein
MEDKILLKISLISACIGLFILFFIFENSEINVYSIDEINALEENDKIIVFGEVMNLNENDNVASFDISEYKIISQKAVFFKKANESTGLKKGDIVKITGTWYDKKVIIDNFEKI